MTISTMVQERLRRTSADRFWAPHDFAGIGQPLQIDRVLSRLAAQGELRQVRRGLYWRGRPTPFGMSRPSTADLVTAVVGTRGVGPAGLSAANELGLTTQVPAVEVVAVPRRTPRPIPGVRFVDRSGRSGRADAGLNATEVALLEVLGEWDRLVEDDAAARRRIVDLVRSGAVRTDRVVRAGRNEPARVRDALRRLLVEAGEVDAAAKVPPPRSERLAPAA